MLRPFETRTLHAGDRLAETLYTRHGAKLLGAGTRLTPGMVRSLRRMPRGSVMVRRGGRTAPAPTSPRSPSSRAPETAAGPAVRRVRLSAADEFIALRARRWARLPLRIPPGAPPIDLDESDPPGWPTDDELAGLRAAWVGRARGLIERLARSEADGALADALHVIEAPLARLRSHPGRFGLLALIGREGDHDPLADHSLTVCCLSMAIAARLGWSADDVRLAGLAGLLADVGMALVPRSLREAERPLDDAEMNRILRHPAQGAMLLDAVERLPERVRLAVAQHQERENGRGYPRRIGGEAISDLARVVAVADSFAAAAHPRAWRPRRRPYEAMEELITLAAAGWLHRPAVRALTRAIGLYPVGSWVRLSDGSVARVRRVDPGAIDRPVVAPSAYRAIDLASEAGRSLSVVGAADAPGAGALAASIGRPVGAGIIGP